MNATCIREEQGFLGSTFNPANYGGFQVEFHSPMWKVLTWTIEFFSELPKECSNVKHYVYLIVYLNTKVGPKCYVESVVC